MVTSTSDRTITHIEYGTVKERDERIDAWAANACSVCPSAIDLNSRRGWSACRVCSRFYCRSCIGDLKIARMFWVLTTRLCGDCGGAIGFPAATGRMA